MELSITAPGGSEMQIIAALPKNFNGHNLVNATPITGTAMFGDIALQNYEGDGFSIWYSNYNIQHKTILVGKANTPALEFHIQFLNDFNTVWDGVGEATMNKYRYNITYVPFIHNKAEFDAVKSYHTFDVHFAVPYLQRLAPYFPVLDTFLNKVVKSQASSISDIDRFLTPGMVAIVNQVLKCPFRNGAAGHYIESKVMELLLLALEQLSEIHPLAPVKLSPYDVERLHEARSLIVQDFENKMSLLQLSRRVGINDFKLKKGFKYLFGTTVFDYLQIERMNKAKQLVTDTELSFAHIALKLGYESESSFNKAFKKQFDVTPGYMRGKKN